MKTKITLMLALFVISSIFVFVAIDNYEKTQQINNYNIQISEHVKQNEQLEQKLAFAQSLVKELSNTLSDLEIRQADLETELEQLKHPTYTMKATAYVASCKGCSGITKTGLDVRTGVHKIIAVDKSIIPLGSEVEIFVDGKSLGIRKAMDTGGAIKGNRIDILMPTLEEANDFGVKQVQVKVLRRGGSWT